MRVLGLVPARGGSRRLGRKNLTMLGGKTLVRRALETAVASRSLETVAISSEDPEILSQAEGMGSVVPVERPVGLATDEARAYDVVAHALTSLERDREPFDAVALIQCTSPFTSPEDVAGAVKMLERTGAGSVVSVMEVDAPLHPLKLKRMEGDRLLPFIEDDQMRPSQELPQLWVRNGSIYVSRRGTLEQGGLISKDVRGYAMPGERSLDINTDLDLAFAEFLLLRGSL